MSNPNYIASHWEDYATLASKGTTEEQLRELRRAFYAGANALLLTVLDNLEESDDEKRDVQVVDNIYEEFELFAKAMSRGDA